MTDSNEVVRHADFSLSPEPVTMTIAPDTFELVPEIPLDALTDMMNIGTKMEGEDRSQWMERIYQFFDGLMTPDSAAKFRERGRKSTPDNVNRNPIGMRHIQNILPWLMEVYGLRPTQESSESSDGSEPTSTDSTDGASAEVLTTSS